MGRDFMEERRWQLIKEETEKLVHPAYRKLYMQNPLFRWLWNASPKELVEYRRRFLAEQEAAGNILPRKPKEQF